MEKKKNFGFEWTRCFGGEGKRRGYKHICDYTHRAISHPRRYSAQALTAHPSCTETAGDELQG